jgi:hypothetical protein
MNFSASSFALLVLSLAAILAMASGLADRVVSEQIVATNYRSVRLIRALRMRRSSAALAVLVFMAVSFCEAPLMPGLVLLVVALATVTLAARALDDGGSNHVFFAGILPAVVVAFTGMNLQALMISPGYGLQLSALTLVPAILCAAWFSSRD